MLLRYRLPGSSLSELLGSIEHIAFKFGILKKAKGYLCNSRGVIRKDEQLITDVFQFLKLWYSGGDDRFFRSYGKMKRAGGRSVLLVIRK
jgi:hypothetical protein